ncbi:MAG: carbon-nitrogen hydrolase family protein [Deltaproteobacteria bacterium]|nr:carbon-nitrogen hydrolase family protein [Deltaproteobacteria bacterium]
METVTNSSQIQEHTLHIGMAQLLVEGGEPSRNFERAYTLLQKAHQERCDLVLFPECMDLAWTHPSALKEAQAIPGPYSDLLCQYAQEFKIIICAGLTEKDTSHIYNSAVLIDSTGKLLLKHRKINLLTPAEDMYSIGTHLSCIDMPFGRVGINICSDNYMDSIEIGHTLARMGAQLILSPCSWTVDYFFQENTNPYGAKWFKPYFTLASLHHLVIIGTTSVGVIVGGPYEGKKMVGCSLAVGPQGLLCQGKYNEFSGELITTQISIPNHNRRGTAIGEHLRHHGYYQNHYLLKLDQKLLERS